MAVVVSCMAAARYGVLMSKIGHASIAEERFGVLVLLPERSDRWMEDLSFFAIIKKTIFDPELANVAFHRSREED